MNRTRITLAVACAMALSAVAVTAQLALAHSRPIRFDPPPGAVLTTAPVKVDGWFTSDLRRDPNWSFLHVSDAQGNRVDAGDATVSSDRRSMSVGLKSGLGPGRYLVTWRTFDDLDGEIFGDCYTFFVGQAAADAAISDKARLDGGSACQRIEVGTANGTPVPGSTPVASDEDHDESESATTDSDGGGVPVWALIIGVGGGLAVGMVGGRIIGGKA